MFYGDSFYGYDPFWDNGGIFFVIVATVIAGMILFAIVNGLRTWNKNNNSPILTVTAEVVNLRQDVNHHHSGDHHHHSSTDYYASFQVESGDRIELSISGQEYGQLAINDVGRLTFQGTRYKGFERY